MNLIATDFAFWWILLTISSVCYDLLSYDARVKKATGRTPAKCDSWWRKLFDI